MLITHKQRFFRDYIAYNSVINLLSYIYQKSLRWIICYIHSSQSNDLTSKYSSSNRQKVSCMNVKNHWQCNK